MSSREELAAALVLRRHYLSVQCRVGSRKLARDRNRLDPDPNLWSVEVGTPPGPSPVLAA
jgi:hypothetical protein